MKGAKKIPEWKTKKLKELSDTLSKYKTIAIVNLENLPNMQLKKIRTKLSDSALLYVTRKSIITRALEGAKSENLKKLCSYVKGVPAVLLSNKDSFELYKILKENQSSAPAKAGQIAPDNIGVPAGPTPFAPGPIIGELGALGIKTGVEGGKIAIKEDSMIVKEGQKISASAANILTRLNILPMKIGLNLIAAVDNDVLYEKNVLDIDMEQYIENVKLAHSDAFKLSLEKGIINNETVTFLISKAHLEAKSLAVSEEILTSETAGMVLAKAEATASKLNDMIK